MKGKGALALVGTWAVHNYTYIQDGVPTIIPHWGSGINGAISYSQSGWVVTSLRSSDAALLPLNLTYPPRDDQLDSDWAKIGKTTLSYWGPYTAVPTTELTGSVVHGPLVGSHVPRSVGSTLQRNYTVVKTDEGTFLNLVFGSDAVQSLWWRKLD